jgi:cytochrome c-type biogenesis protein CcmE
LRPHIALDSLRRKVPRRVKFLVGSLVIVAAVGTLIYAAVRETSAYFMTVEEYAADPGSHAEKSLRLAGRVRDGSVDWNPVTLDLAFTIQPIPPRAAEGAPAAPAPAEPAAGMTLPVRYNGILPDMFAAGRDVIVEGRVEGGVFHANTLLTTCPSKYEADVPHDEAQAGTTSSASGAS